MYEWLLSLLPILIGGETPQKQVGVPGAPGTLRGGTPAQESKPGETPVKIPSGAGVPGGESGGGAATPTLAVIEDTVFYQVDPNDPSNRFLGTQVREAFNRAGRFDALQSTHHLTQNQNRELAAENETLRSQLTDLTRNSELQTRLAQMGVPVQQRGVQPLGQGSWNQYGSQVPFGQGNPGAAQPGVDEWMLDPSAPNQAPPNTPTGIPEWLQDPAKFIQVIRPSIQQEIVQALTQNPEVQQQFGQAVGNSVGETVSTVEEERYAREMTARTLAQDKEEQAQTLRNIGVAETEINRILAMQSQSAEKHREAEILMGVTGPEREQSLALAQLALKQGQNLIQKAAQARADALMAWKEKEKQMNAQQILETDGFGVDLSDLPTDPNEVRKFDQKEIDADRRLKLAKAKEIMAAKSRARASAGVI